MNQSKPMQDQGRYPASPTQGPMPGQWGSESRRPIPARYAPSQLFILAIVVGSALAAWAALEWDNTQNLETFGPVAGTLLLYGLVPATALWTWFMLSYWLKRYDIMTSRMLDPEHPNPAGWKLYAIVVPCAAFLGALALAGPGALATMGANRLGYQETVMVRGVVVEKWSTPATWKDPIHDTLGTLVVRGTDGVERQAHVSADEYRNTEVGALILHTKLRGSLGFTYTP